MADCDKLDLILVIEFIKLNPWFNILTGAGQHGQNLLFRSLPDTSTNTSTAECRDNLHRVAEATVILRRPLWDCRDCSDLSGVAETTAISRRPPWDRGGTACFFFPFLYFLIFFFFTFCIFYFLNI